MKKRYVENRRSLRFVARTLAKYTALDGMPFEMQCLKLREARSRLRHWQTRWREADSLPCGHQDTIGDALDEASQEFWATLNGLRLARGVIAPRFQRNVLYVIQ